MNSLVCTIFIVASLVLLYYAFSYIFLGKTDSETELQLISRQLRGFALWMIAGSVSMSAIYYCNLERK